MTLVYLAREVLPAMRDRKWGRIVALGSMGIKTPHTKGEFMLADKRYCYPLIYLNASLARASQTAIRPPGYLSRADCGIVVTAHIRPPLPQTSGVASSFSRDFVVSAWERFRQRAPLSVNQRGPSPPAKRSGHSPIRSARRLDPDTTRCPRGTAHGQRLARPRRLVRPAPTCEPLAVLGYPVACDRARRIDQVLRGIGIETMTLRERRGDKLDQILALSPTGPDWTPLPGQLSMPVHIKAAPNAKLGRNRDLRMAVFTLAIPRSYWFCARP
jgi:hypothetical protein